MRFGPGERLCGRYDLRDELGRPGKSGYALAAHDSLTGDEVVCKVGLAPDGSTKAEFKAQLKKLRAVRGRDVVEALGYDEHVADDGCRYPVLILERVQGRDAGAWLATDPGPKERLEILARIASALMSLHAAGIAHGDLDGDGNVLISGDRAALIDPEPQLWGSTDDDVVTEQVGDAGSLSRLIVRVLAGSVPGSEGLTAQLASGTRFTVAAITAELWALLGSPEVPAATLATFRASARYHLAERARRHAAFRSFREQRELAIAGLVSRLEATAGHYGHVLDTPDVDLAVSRERASDDRPLGAFHTRELIMTSGDDPRDVWTVTIRGHGGFRKPLPFDDATLLSSGHSRLVVAGDVVRSSELILRMTDGVATWHVLRGSVEEPLEDAWIQRHIVELSGHTAGD